jgi:alkylation response protein AidB-like acyl-CoA dehydrogenase
MLKIRGTEIQQMLTELMMDAVGPEARVVRHILPGAAGAVVLPDAAGAVVIPDAASAAMVRDLSQIFAPRYCNFRKTSIYAGSNEIQRNIIAKMSLGL